MNNGIDHQTYPNKKSESTKDIHVHAPEMRELERKIDAKVIKNRPFTVVNWGNK
jgi:hypothetical protein